MQKKDSLLNDLIKDQKSCFLGIILSAITPTLVGFIPFLFHFSSHKILGKVKLDSHLWVLSFSVGLIVTLFFMLLAYPLSISMKSKINNIIIAFGASTITQGYLFLTGFSIFLLYFYKNSFFPALEPKLLLAVFKTSIGLLAISSAIFYCIKWVFKNIPLKIMLVINLTILLFITFSNNILSPEIIVKKFNFGNYAATLTIGKEHSYVLDRIMKNNESGNVHVIWNLGDFVYVKNEAGYQAAFNKNFVTVIRKKYGGR